MRTCSGSSSASEDDYLHANGYTEGNAPHGNPLRGGAGNDTLLGDERSRDTLHGGVGNDFLWDSSGADSQFGDQGADTLRGGAGGDTLEGGRGADLLRGEAGADVLLYRLALDGNDTIADFLSGLDRIAVSAASFGGGLIAGAALPAARFTTNLSGVSNAPGGFGQFVYEADAGRLWWDSDGMGAAREVLIAMVAPASGSLMTADNIIVV